MVEVTIISKNAKKKKVVVREEQIISMIGHCGIFLSWGKNEGK